MTPAPVATGFRWISGLGVGASLGASVVGFAYGRHPGWFPGFPSVTEAVIVGALAGFATSGLIGRVIGLITRPLDRYLSVVETVFVASGLRRAAVLDPDAAADIIEQAAIKFALGDEAVRQLPYQKIRAAAAGGTAKALPPSGEQVGR